MNKKGLTQLKTIFRFEYTEFIRAKAYKITTVIFALLIIFCLGFLPSIIEGFANKTNPSKPSNYTNISVVDEANLFSGDLSILKASIPKCKFTSVKYEGEPTINTLKRDIDSGKIDGAMVIEEELRYVYYSKNADTDSMPPVLLKAVKTQYQLTKMIGAGMSIDNAANALAEPQFETVTVGKSMLDTYMITYVLIMLLYMFILMYGQMVSTSVATEKSSRAMELLITSARPNNLIFGKIFASGLAGLTQMGIWIAITVFMLDTNKAFWHKIPMFSGVYATPVNVIFYMLLFYILGFLMYACIFGAMGSLVSRIEDINSVAAPMQLLFVAGFLISIIGMTNPEMLLLKIFSFIPIYTPMCMFVRISMSQVPFYQIAISIILTGATTALFAWLSAKIYRVGVLMYGKPPKIGELFSALRNQKKY